MNRVLTVLTRLGWTQAVRPNVDGLRSLVGRAKAHCVGQVSRNGLLCAFAHAVQPLRLTAWAKSREAGTRCHQLRQATLPTLRFSASVRANRGGIKARRRMA